MKKASYIIWGVVILVALAAAGVGVWYFFLRNKGNSADQAVAQLHQAVRGHKISAASKVVKPVVIPPPSPAPSVPGKFPMSSLVDSSSGAVIAYLIQLPLLIDGTVTTFPAQIDTGSYFLMLLTTACSGCQKFITTNHFNAWDASQAAIPNSDQSFSFLGGSYTVEFWKGQLNTPLIQSSTGSQSVPITFAGVTDMAATDPYAMPIGGMLPVAPSSSNPHNMPALLPQLAPSLSFTANFIPGQESVEFGAVDTSGTAIPLASSADLQKIFGGVPSVAIPYYIVPIASMSYTSGGSPVKLSDIPQYAIIDTGTTMTLMGTSPFANITGQITLNIELGVAPNTVTLSQQFNDAATNVVSNSMFTQPPFTSLMLIGLNMLLGNVLSFDCKNKVMTAR